MHALVRGTASLLPRPFARWRALKGNHPWTPQFLFAAASDVASGDDPLWLSGVRAYRALPCGSRRSTRAPR